MAKRMPTSRGQALREPVAIYGGPAVRLCSIGTGQLQARRAVPWATQVLRDHLLNVKNHSFVSFWGSHAGLRLMHQRQSESL